jgi:hypothetical protein
VVLQIARWSDGRPWPSVAGARKFFQPEVGVEGSTLRMWFGGRSSPTLAFSDVDLSELR